MAGKLSQSLPFRPVDGHYDDHSRFKEAPWGHGGGPAELEPGDSELLTSHRHENKDTVDLKERLDQPLVRSGVDTNSLSLPYPHTITPHSPTT